MGTGIFIGIVLCLVLEGMFLFGVRAWRKTLPPDPPQPPRTPAQQANEAVYEELRATTPRVVSMRLQRRTTRGRSRVNMEDEYNPFE